MVVQRGLKILLVGGLAFLCALTTWGNLRDPATNYTFVRHVVSMDTISPENAMATNAIQIPLVWSIAFWAIVAAEGLTTALFAWGTVELFQAHKFKARSLTRPSVLFLPGRVALSENGNCFIGFQQTVVCAMDLREEMDSGQIFLAKTSFKITAKGNCRLKRTASLFNSHGQASDFGQMVEIACL
jgi:predicted small integral membrane protein